MRISKIPSAFLTLLFCSVSIAYSQDAGRIYGKILTTYGDEFEGFIRWDKNEANWVDMLNGTKKIDREWMREARRKYREQFGDDRESRRFNWFGIRINDRSSSIWATSSTSGIRIGHVKRIEPSGRDKATLVLKSGEEVEFSGGSTDIGTDVREIIIEDRDEGEVELEWRDIEEVKFEQAPSSARSEFSERLYGTLTTRDGEKFTGLVCWDVDEIFADDILDGDHRNRKRRIRFGDIEALERYSSSGAKVFLKDGDEIVLRGSNDVNDSNRGIIISDPDFGQVQVSWRDFESLELQRYRARFSYDDFDGGRRLFGTVYLEDGKKFRGEIVWDNDEAYTWEILDGEDNGLQYDIEFGKVKSIEKASSRSAIVTIRNGREFELRDSNDIDSGNRGVWIDSRDDLEYVSWADFEKIVFERN